MNDFIWNVLEFLGISGIAINQEIGNIAIFPISIIAIIGIIIAYYYYKDKIEKITDIIELRTKNHIMIVIYGWLMGFALYIFLSISGYIQSPNYIPVVIFIWVILNLILLCSNIIKLVRDANKQLKTKDFFSSILLKIKSIFFPIMKYIKLVALVFTQAWFTLIVILYSLREILPGEKEGSKIPSNALIPIVVYLLLVLLILGECSVSIENSFKDKKGIFDKNANSKHKSDNFEENSIIKEVGKTPECVQTKEKIR